MYHDQGLPVLKAQGFGEAINTTFGLPFIRTRQITAPPNPSGHGQGGRWQSWRRHR